MKSGPKREFPRLTQTDTVIYPSNIIISKEFNIHQFSDINMISLALPSKNVVQIARELHVRGVDKVISLDLSYNSSIFQGALKSVGIKLIARSDLEIPDFYEPAELPVEQMLAICKEIDVQSTTAVHCRGGNGRSGVIVAAKMLHNQLAHIAPDTVCPDLQPSLVQETCYSDNMLSVEPSVAAVIENIRMVNPRALERAEDVNKVDEFYLFLKYLTTKSEEA